ncbi:hypothetical protein K466DRAFT_238224 [Polyporus arcularius HHB13444]|uniref:Uncharacterized protein n=1 Tax=Polyporus arcularius HHB13444 TaxID=1314778 RepID=A0A5C3P650_9APHY|nr:hypothetical protein K466DRAFT_238224 [Polyporus arcularius HHB13444]
MSRPRLRGDPVSSLHVLSRPPPRKLRIVQHDGAHTRDFNYINHTLDRARPLYLPLDLRRSTRPTTVHIAGIPLGGALGAALLFAAVRTETFGSETCAASSTVMAGWRPDIGEGHVGTGIRRYVKETCWYCITACTPSSLTSCIRHGVCASQCLPSPL